MQAQGEGDTTLVGYSYGAYLVARICVRQDVAVDRAVLIGGFAGLPEEMVRVRQELAEAIESDALSAAELVSTCRSLFVCKPEDREVVRVSDEIAQSVSREQLVRFVRRINEAGHPEVSVPRFDTPALVLHDPDDAAVPIVLGEELAALGSRAELLHIESGGHVGMVARPAMIAGHVFGEPS